MSRANVGDAQWIWIHDKQLLKENQQHEHIYFRKSFVLDHTEDLVLHIKVSADSRYRLYVNGYKVSQGPSKGDNHTHYYEEVDCTPYLCKGRNVIAAKVIHYDALNPFVVGKGGPVSVWRASSGGFLLSGEVLDSESNSIIKLHTDDSWLCLQETAITYEVSYMETGYLGGLERVDGQKLAYGWNTIEYDDSDWERGVKVSDNEDVNYGQLMPWNLTPRNIPQLYEKDCTYKQATKINGRIVNAPEGSTYIEKPFTIGPNQIFKIEFDAGELTTGYPVLVLIHGKKAKVKLLYAECYEKRDPVTGVRVKELRNDATGELFGEYDLYETGGFGSADYPEIYEPFLFRTFRYLLLEIETAEEELTVQSISYKETGYPLEIRSSFSSSDDSLQPLWNISINTLKRCMHETYEDCPYYEQLQYAMDTRLQALFTYQLSGDDRLARKAIFDFHSSRLPNGMLQSRYPSVLPQVIPGFSLHWIMMVHDHYQYFGDLSLVRTYLPTIDGVLEWFNQRLETNGLLGEMPSQYWSFVDWVDEWREERGVPTASKYGSITIYNLMYAAVLKLASELQDASGRRDTGDEYRVRAEALLQAVNRTSYSENSGLYRDGPQVELYSQHAQIWAVLAGAVQGEAAAQLMERVLSDHSLAKVSYAMSFFLFRALEETGAYDRSFSLWDTWRDLAALGLTSWVEDPVSQRSDCHAWGAVPIYEFTANILGVKPASPGSTRIRIAPQPGHLKRAAGEVAVRNGIVRISWEINEQNQFALTVSSRIDAQFEITLPDHTLHIVRAGKNLHFLCPLT
ncbi:alpha-L-rhamnosidase-related protein [Paenibacillus sp. SYP-B4298]|uniref:alpha-L-rhamnosidase-related protein n=1 Tax=Paenibacillus sp. SYP-B4298 TaxID=2996034 RepID=UPI0022DDE46A|nr:alpha-L-rhamnosidase N-terminal domain-containing protein [Paenibacillus sp. SYP-B4298]